MITKEEILNDPNIPDNYVDRARGWVNEAFLDGVDYAERKLTESPWVKFKDRRPEMGRLNTVIVKQGRYVCIAYLCYFNGRFHWNMGENGYTLALDNDHWMLIPKLKEE